MKDLEIIFEDKDILVCRKPAGVATQTKRLGQQDMESLLKNYRVQKGEPAYIGIVHRLDQPVEGIMVFAKNQQSAANLSKQVQDRVIGKYYYALLNNASDLYSHRPQGELEDYLITDKKTNYTRVIDKEVWENAQEALPKEAKYAKLEYKYVSTAGEKSLFEIKLHTGRQHQIRVQMANAGCPLVGDSKYGESGLKEQLALCSYKLEFEHPTKKNPMKFEIQPLGKVFIEFFQ